MQLTIGEKKFLQNLFVNEKRIEEGKLYAYQIRVLEQYRMAMHYLHQKYPDTEFEIIMGNPQNRMSSLAEFVFKASGESDTFQLSISEVNDSYMIKDNYYGSLIREMYDEYIFRNLQGKINGLIAVYSQIREMKEKEYDSNIKMEDIVNQKLQIFPMTHIYISATKSTSDEWQQLVKQTVACIKTLDLYGAYSIFGVDNSLKKFATAKECYIHVQQGGYCYMDGYQHFNREV